MCLFGLHDLPPEQKLRVIREIVKVVRHNGSLHVVDFDKPENRSERRILEFATRISGSTAVEPHINGTWTEFLTEGGLAGVRRQSSHSVGIGRIATIRARKR
jgi:ubiquinone/menaquinone biosynthesis C-methylase UbiE